jgi:hypothetical protein
MDSIAIIGLGGVVMKCNYLESGHNHGIEPASGGLKRLAPRMKTVGVEKCGINSGLRDDEPNWLGELDTGKYTPAQCTVTTGSRLFAGKARIRQWAAACLPDYLQLFKYRDANQIGGGSLEAPKEKSIS